jgi:NitT/TauT family transport system ATP-binding protein
MPKLSIRGVSKRFQSSTAEVLALENVWLDVEEGEFLVLVGPSGCGKSTLLNVIAGLDPADAGEVLEDGRPLRGPGRDRGLVFQDGALFPWLTAQKNVEFGLKQLGMGRRERSEKAAAALEMVHLAQFRDSFPHELSGGMRQRVAIARALAIDPDVLLMDEPFAALDALTREDLYEQLAELWERTGKTIVFVTHNVREAVCLGDRVVLMSARPGRVEAEFPVHLGRPRYMDDVAVARAAHQISVVMKRDRARAAEEAGNDGNDGAAGGLLCGAAPGLGDCRPA